jgi:hypothetical protein
MDYTKKLKDLRGNEFPKTFPSQKEMDALPRKKNRVGQEEPDIDKLEKETIGNIILNCLATHKCEDRKEGFYINLVADSVLGGAKSGELKDKYYKFMIEVLEDSIIRDEKIKGDDGKEKTVNKGVYAGWLIAQVLTALGEKIE